MAKNQGSYFYSFTKKLLQHEKNAVSLPAEARLKLVLIFPNSYAVGMANLGFQAVYRLFNEFPGVRCERAFYYEQFPTISKSLESNRELRDFEIVAFSISFEIDLPNVIQILKNAGITPLSAERHVREPLVIAGGALTFLNPAPLEPFVDAFVLGELEPVLEPFMNSLLEAKKQRLSKNETLKLIDSLSGIYVPNLFEETKKIPRIYFDLKNQPPQYSPIVTPYSHFKNMFLTEVGRGCGRRCHFCAASFIYHPFRLFSTQQIMETVQAKNKFTNKIGLVGAAISDYPAIEELCELLVTQGYELGLSSSRLDKMTPFFLKILERGKVNSITFAPEAGTERLRKLIHKNLTDEQIAQATHAVAQSFIRQIKLYFLIGLPGETWDDVKGIVTLVGSMQSVFIKNKKPKKITVSINTFIPKPSTPFQWSAMEGIDEIKRKRKFLQKGLKKISGIQIIAKSSKEEILQAVFSLGDRKVGLAIYDKLSRQLDWQQAWERAKINVEQTIMASKNYEAKFPWDFIDSGFRKENLWKLWQQSKE